MKFNFSIEIYQWIYHKILPCAYKKKKQINYDQRLIYIIA